MKFRVSVGNRYLNDLSVKQLLRDNLAMKILFHSYDMSFIRMGGGERVILSLQHYLRENGVEAEIYNPWIHHIAEFDLVHSFSTRDIEFWKHMKLTFGSIPLVVTPTVNPFRGHLSNFKKIKDLCVDKINRSFFAYPDLYLPTTSVEAQFIQKRYGIRKDRVKIFTNGVSDIFTNSDPSIAISKFCIPRDKKILLSVGRFEETKNQLSLINSLNGLKNIHLVLVGKADPGKQDYYNKCISRAKLIEESNRSITIQFIDEVSANSELLASLYSACSIYVQPSVFETFGLAAAEAALSGCQLVLSERFAAKDLFSDDAIFVDGSDVNSISNGIKKCIDSKRERKNLVCNNVKTWPELSLDLKGIYAELL